ncbi:MAG TPA: hypothetical protein VJZ49_15700 [Syntrophales bacterium]|nr:hypothetical protein [Syntrophales bacterium]
MPEENSKSIFQKIGDAVVNFAPGIAGILAATGVGAPASGAVIALSALGKSFGLGTQATPADILKVVTTDPEIQLKAMQAENSFTLAMRQADLDEIKAGLGDIQSARQRDTAIRSTGQLNVRADVMLAGTYVSIIAIIVVLAFTGIGANLLVAGCLTTLVGTLVKYIGTAFDFEFGSSRGSIQKTEIAADTAKELARVAAGQ